MRKLKIMTKIITLACSCLLIAAQITAQRVVTLHSSSGVSAFSSVNPFVDAYNAASNGDTIYLPGGVVNPPGNFSKRLYIYGAGMHPDSTQATFPSVINGGINFNHADANHTHIEGVQILGTFSVTSNLQMTGLTVKRCYITGGITISGSGSTNLSSNFGFIESVLLGDANIFFLTNSTFSNCLFTGRITSSKGNNFENNISLYQGSGSFSTAYVFFSCDNNNIKNNIFINTLNSRAFSGSGNIISNNLFCATSPNFSGADIVINNYLGVPQQDIFVNQQGNSFSFSHDYHLQNPSLYLGTDGTEVGIFGGIFPVKPKYVPINPHIVSKNIAPTTNNQGELEIQIQVAGQNH